MSSDVLDNSTARGARHGWGMVVLAGACILCLAPFLNRAFNIDEPLFLKTAAQIRAHPLDFYGFDINGYWTTMRMSELMKNPPLASYYIALVEAMGGTSEVALHAAFLLPAIGLMLGTYRLAQQLCDRPLLAGMLALASPAVLISAASVMCDITMMCGWIWALDLWLRGVKSDRFGMLCTAALLAGASALTKYFAVSLIPLMIAVGIAHKRRAGWWIAPLVIPVLMLTAYQLYTAHLYGRGLLLDAADYASDPQWHGGKLLAGVMAGLSFTGGSCLASAPLLAWTSRARERDVWIFLSAAAMFVLLSVNVFPSDPISTEWGFAFFYFAQLAGWTVLGIVVLVATGAELIEQRTTEAWLLALWIFGTFIFAGLLNWTVNGRTILPIVPAAAILAVRRVSRREPARVGWGWAVVAPAALVTVLCVHADARFADATREATIELAGAARAYSRAPLYINAHWGFQYYLEKLGARDLDVLKYRFVPGDLFATTSTTTNVVDVHRFRAQQERIARIEKVTCSFLTVMRGDRHAGFYSHVYGPLPFAFGRVPPEQFDLYVLSPRAPER